MGQSSSRSRTVVASFVVTHRVLWDLQPWFTNEAFGKHTPDEFWGTVFWDEPLSPDEGRHRVARSPRFLAPSGGQGEKRPRSTTSKSFIKIFIFTWCSLSYQRCTFLSLKKGISKPTSHFFSILSVMLSSLLSRDSCHFSQRF